MTNGSLQSDCDEPFLFQVGVAGFEPTTSASRTHEQISVSASRKGLASSEKVGCTTGCTSEAENVKAGADSARDADPLATLTAAALKLTKADRQRLLVVLAASLGADDD